MDVYRSLGFLAPPALFFGSLLLGFGLFEPTKAEPWGIALIGFGLAALYVKLEEIALLHRGKPG